MEENEMNPINEEYFNIEYNSFLEYCNLIIQGLDFYKKARDEIVKRAGKNAKGSKLREWVENGFIYSGKGEIQYCVQVDNKYNFYQYKYFNKKGFENQKWINKIFNLKSYRALCDLNRLVKFTLLNISNKIKHININKDTIKLILEDDVLKVIYNIHKKKPDFNHEFGILIHEDEITIDYEKEKGKIILLKKFDFNLLYCKLKQFIAEEKTY